MRLLIARLVLVLCVIAPLSAQALDAVALATIAQGDNSTKIKAIEALVAAGDAQAIPALQALLDGALHIGSNKQVVIVNEAGIVDAVALTPVAISENELEKISINNRVRLTLATALSALSITADDPATRLRAAIQLQDNAEPVLLPLIERALARETDARVGEILHAIHARLNLQNPDVQKRAAAAKRLGDSASAANRSLLQQRLSKDADGRFTEPDASVRQELQQSIARIDAKLEAAEYAGRFFTGLSLGSILLLAALGLAITFGLMGIINMAHGELLMVGAYATYVVQGLFRSYLPHWFDWYLLAAVPVAFAAALLVGIAMERGVIRFLYGRPLETLLATWGISLALIQTVRLIFGAQNVEVTNPSWMSGAFVPMSGLVLPYNRMVIVAFAAAVVLLVWLILNRTRMGLYVRAVTQNRRMADCLGVATPKVDMLAFGIGSGIAGLGGVALSQIGNVGPELGQGYIVDSFMVVVLGGVGQLMGTVIAAIGLGEINKLLEPYAGAVLGKIFVLVLIIIFIQKRPQGLFAPKGRMAED